MTSTRPLYQVRIQNPSGETRLIPLDKNQEVFKMGRTSECEIYLSDPTLPALTGTLHAYSGISSEEFPFHLQLHSPTPKSCRLGDFWVREALLPLEIPFEIGETTFTIEKIRTSVRAQPSQPDGIPHWKTVSPEGEELIWMTKKSAPTSLSLYIAGETGTGKEVIAHLIHAWSERASGPFVPLHCGALSPTLAESELFGHVKGAYTGANQNRTGALLQAHNGTLFLDEVGDLSLETQVKLLRFLENGEIKAVGSDRVIKADVRILCATHLPLKDLVEQGKFRRDLYYRLASITLPLPTLRSRPADIELLARTFAHGLKKSLSPQALTRLQSYTWPGNVRELRHAIERAAGISGPFETVLSENSFYFLIEESDRATSQLSAAENPLALLNLDQLEKQTLIRALKICHGNRTDAAKLLGIARSTLFEMLKRHRIPGPKAQRAREKLMRENLFKLRETQADVVRKESRSAHDEAGKEHVNDFAFDASSA